MSMKVPFHRRLDPSLILPSFQERLQALPTSAGRWNEELEQWLTAYFKRGQPFPTSSCTHALEAIALAMDLQVGDEIIVPSFTYVTSASAFALRGATLVFADVEPDTMNIDLDEVALLITPKTKALLVMHYAGLCCDMDRALSLCAEHQILLIEDAAHGIGATFRDQALGSVGDAGTLSFHHTKNIQCGEGGALHCAHPHLLYKLQKVLNKGTNRTEFDAGKVDFYTWVELGSSSTLSDLSAAWLLSELALLEKTTMERRAMAQVYIDGLSSLQEKEVLLPGTRSYGENNGHIFFLKTRNSKERPELIRFLHEKGISAYFHYSPLHLSPAGQKYGTTPRSCDITTEHAERLVRLPIYPGLARAEQEYIIDQIHQFYSS